jgi:Sap, sulfolipid-1-addressing protein
MLAVTLLVASVAIADSINPSTIVPALWLARAPNARGLASYTLGVFSVYLAGGLVLVFGPGPTLIAGARNVGAPIEHTLEVAGGVLALAFALALWRTRHRELPDQRLPRGHRRPAAFTLGAGIMALELPTAFMYFGAISAILAPRPGGVVEVSLLLVYNALFVAPLLAILGTRRVADEHAARWLALSEQWLRRFGQPALATAAGAAGAVFLLLGVGGLITT